MQIGNFQASISDSPMEIQCQCGELLYTVPSGWALKVKGRSGSVVRFKTVKCAGCSKERNLTFTAEH